MCSNMLETTCILWQRKHGRPHKFLQVGTSLNNFKHERKKGPTPHEENGPQKEKKAFPHEGKGPSKEEKAPYIISFWIFNGGGRAPRESCICPPPLVTHERK